MTCSVRVRSIQVLHRHAAGTRRQGGSSNKTRAYELSVKKINVKYEAMQAPFHDRCADLKMSSAKPVRRAYFSYDDRPEVKSNSHSQLSIIQQIQCSLNCQKVVQVANISISTHN